MFILTVIFLNLKLLQSQHLVVDHGNSQYNISYTLNTSNCSLLESPNVSNAVKCLILCQTTKCKSLEINNAQNSCLLNGSQPELIQHDRLPGLNISYVLEYFLGYGNSCRFDFTCFGDGKCMNGSCRCMRDIEKFNQGLINEWTLNNTLLDSVQCNDLIRFPNANFTLDSVNPLEYSAHFPANGYLSAPSDVYFNGDLSISAWVYVLEFRSWSRILDFGNGNPQDNVYVALTVAATGRPTSMVYSNQNWPTASTPSTPLQLNTWVHMAVTVRNASLTIYVNGSFACESLQYAARNVVRERNYIGRSNWPSDSLARAKIKRLRIYNRALNASEVSDDMGN